MPESNTLYEPLPATEPPSIRLLHIFPSTKPDDPICCTLSVHSLTPDLKFTNLSYEWGRPHKPTKEHPAYTLVVNNLKVEVQPNLYHALYHLRSKEAKLVIWIDAICINQNDNDEKIQQVGLMAELYGRAERTLAWIGVGTPDSIRPPWNFSEWTDAESKNYDLLSRSFSVEAPALRRLRGQYRQPRPTEDNGFSLMRVLVEAHCNSNVRYEVSWHQDRIYGLAGMAADIPHLERFDFKIEYGVPCTDSYTNAARSIILSGGVDLLALSNFPKVERMPSWVPDWRVPVRRPRGGFPWDTQFCVTKDLHRPENISHRTEWDDPLVLTGCVVDVVYHMSSPWQPGDVGYRLQSRQTLGYLLGVQNIIWMAGERQKKLEKPIYSVSDARHVLAVMPVGDQLQAGTSVPPEGRTEYLSKGYVGAMKDLDRNFVLDTKMWIAFRVSFDVKFEGFPVLSDMKPLPSTKDTMAEFNTKDSYYKMMDRQSGTRPFVGDKGYIGLVPVLAERGDVVIIFRGAKFPYVLRKKVNGKHAGKYELVGETYVHGVMYGEFVANGPE